MANQKTLTISIVTPDGSAYQHSDVQMVILNTQSGQMGIMPNHVPVIASLKIDEVKVDYGNRDDEIAVNGGFAEFSNNTITIVANSAEKRSNIDVERAQRAQKRAKAAIQRAKQKHDQVTLQQSEVALERAINRIHVAKH